MWKFPVFFGNEMRFATLLSALFVWFWKKRLTPGRREAEMVEFHDFLPIISQKLDEEGFMEELCSGFRLLADPYTRTITFASLKTNARWLGLEGMTDDDLRAMIMVGDRDGDGELNEYEFCLLMIRTSPFLLTQAQTWLEDALERELEEFMEEDTFEVSWSDR